ncbi:MAG: lamin tail domain-containing protein [Flavobacterium sp.]
MKKLYFLSLTLLMSFFTFGQATDLYFSMYGEGSSNNKFLEIYNGTGAPVDLGNYSVELYTNGSATPNNTQTFTAGTILAAGDVYVLRNTSAALAAIVSASDITSSTCGFNGDDAIALKNSGTIIDVIGQIGVDPGTGWAVAGQTNATVDKTLVRKNSVCSPNPVALGSFGTDANNSEWIVYAIDTELGQLGSHSGCSSTPSISISSPANATIFNPNTTNVNVVLSVNNFNVANGTGDGHIHYTINGGAVVMKYDTDPIAIPVVAGNSYTVYVELVDNSHQPIVPATNATVTFQVAALNVVADLAALRADVIASGAGKYYQISTTPIITFARTTRNQKYIQDATAGILIDDLAGTISTPMTNGDAISGLKGQASLFSGVLQLLPLENATIASSGNTVTPQVVTAADIIANVETYESELVQINNATFTTADGTIAFAASTNYNMNDGTDIAFRTLFSEVDYIGQVVPQGAANRVVLVAEFNGTPQVVARSLADVTLSSSSFNAIEGLTMYPNPLKGNTLYLTSTANAEMSVQIFDLVGKEVLKSNVTNNIVNVSGLTSGVYIVKVIEEGKTATRKLVIQ